MLARAIWSIEESSRRAGSSEYLATSAIECIVPQASQVKTRYKDELYTMSEF